MPVFAKKFARGKILRPLLGLGNWLIRNDHATQTLRSLVPLQCPTLVSTNAEASRFSL
jgi:hypothetical protein